MVIVAGAPYYGLAKEREGAPSTFPRCSRPFFIIFPSISESVLNYMTLNFPDNDNKRDAFVSLIKSFAFDKYEFFDYLKSAEIERDYQREQAIWNKHIAPAVKKHNLRKLSGNLFEYQYIEKKIDGNHLDAMIRESSRWCQSIKFPKANVNPDETNDLFGGELDFSKEVVCRLRDSDPGPHEYELKEGGKIDLRDTLREFLNKLFANGTLPEFLEMLRIFIHEETISDVAPQPQIAISNAPPPVSPVKGNTMGISSEIQRPDYEYWIAQPYWDLFEVPYLLCGCDPDYYKKQLINPSNLKEPHLKIEKMRKLVQRCYDVGEITRHPKSHPGHRWVIPNDCVAWAINKDIDVPKELQDLPTKEDGTEISLPSKQGSHEDKGEQKRRQDTIDKLEMQRIAEDIWLTKKIDLDIKFMIRHPEIIKIHNKFRAYKERRVHDILSEVAPNNVKKPGRRSKAYLGEQEALCKKLGITVSQS